MTLQVKDEKALAQMFTTMLKHVGVTTPTHTPAHGPSGVFNSQADPDVINAMLLPSLGLMARLPVTLTNTINNNYMILTGITANSGTHPATVCEPGKVAGNLAKREIRFPFGNRKMSTDVIAVSEVGQLNNRADFTDFRLLGMNDDLTKTSPTLTPNYRNALNSELQKMMLETQIGWAMEFGRQTYAGNPANNSGDYREFRGLDLLINTPFNDVDGNALPANAIPLVRAALADNLNTQTSTAGPAIVTEIHAIMRALKLRAKRTGLEPVRWAVVMSANAFYEVSAVWPCSYYTYRCGGSTSNPNGTSASDLRQAVDDMRNGQYLLVDGERVEVIIDDGIIETEGTGADANTGTGNFTSSVYIVPLTGAGRPLTYVEAFNFNNPMARELIDAMGKREKFAFQAGGRFMWIFRENAECLSADVRERSRIIMLAPFLSARIASIRYRPAIVVPTGF